jgi:hypothetical protein
VLPRFKPLIENVVEPAKLPLGHVYTRSALRVLPEPLTVEPSALIVFGMQF